MQQTCKWRCLHTSRERKKTQMLIWMQQLRSARFRDCGGVEKTRHIRSFLKLCWLHLSLMVVKRTSRPSLCCIYAFIMLRNRIYLFFSFKNRYATVPKVPSTQDMPQIVPHKFICPGLAAYKCYLIVLYTSFIVPLILFNLFNHLFYWKLRISRSSWVPPPLILSA